jgi:hypothetical protein
MDTERPIRSLVESGTSKIPRGPLGVVGGGNAIGGAGYFTISFINGLNPVDGLDVGYTIESHEIVERNDETGKEVHIFTIHSASEDVARFIAKFRSSPTITQALSRDVEVTDVTEEKSNRTFSRWRVRTVVKPMIDNGPDEEVKA